MRGVHTARVSFAAIAAAMLLTPAAAHAVNVTATGQVMYASPSCDANRKSYGLLERAELVFKDAAGKVIQGDTDDLGAYRVPLANVSPPVNALVRLRGAEITVLPEDGADGNPSGDPNWGTVPGAVPYELDLGEVVDGTGAVQPPRIISGANERTAANLYRVVKDGREFGLSLRVRAIMPAIKVHARWSQDLKSVLPGFGHLASSVRQGRGHIWVGSGGEYEWAIERDALLHEVGHIFHKVLAPTAPDPGRPDSHLPWMAYPGQGQLVLGEGVATWFSEEVDRVAAISMGSQPGLVRLGCETLTNLTATPVTWTEGPITVPIPPERHLAQWNEITVAGALWHVSMALNGGAPRSLNGPARIATAMRDYVGDHGPHPRSPRQLADALIDSVLKRPEGAGGLDRKILEAFWDQRIGWGVALSIEPISSTKTFFPKGCSKLPSDAGNCSEADASHIPTSIATFGAGYDSDQEAVPAWGTDPLSMALLDWPEEHLGSTEAGFAHLSVWNGTPDGLGVIFPHRDKNRHFLEAPYKLFIGAGRCGRWCKSNPPSITLRVVLYTGLAPKTVRDELPWVPDALRTSKPVKITVPTSGVVHVVDIPPDGRPCQWEGGDCSI